ncbi:DEKNAAC101440 [Brettanomyces naardenensis]|uniref:DEKNAAC101440 n=1 Tax=Brettanomyces naardenensis TaxID=13370 RepID=A0A448YII1_BRENA|nr:DEKNAAC101440 [Brettanomyces naardenensis]
MDYNRINQSLKELRQKQQKLDEPTGITYVKGLKQAILGPDEMAKVNSIVVLAKAMEFLPRSDPIFALFDSQLFAYLLDAASLPHTANESMKAVLRILLTFLWGILPETRSPTMYDPLLWNLCDNRPFFESLAAKLADQDIRLALSMVDFVSQLLYRTVELKNAEIMLSEVRCMTDAHFFDTVSMLPYDFKARLDSFAALRKSSQLVLRYLSASSLSSEPFPALINECVIAMTRMMSECGSGRNGTAGPSAANSDYSKVGLPESAAADPQNYIQQHFSPVAAIDLICMLKNPNMTFKKNFSEHTMFAGEATYFPLLKFAVGITELLSHMDTVKYSNFNLIFSYFNGDLYYSFMSSALKFWMASKAEQDDFGHIMTLLETLVAYCDSMLRTESFSSVTDQVISLKYSQIKKFQLEKLRLVKAAAWSESMGSFNGAIGKQVMDFVKNQRFLELSKGSWVYVQNPLDESPAVSGKPVYYFLVLSSNNKSLIYREFIRKHAHAPNIDKDGIVIEFKDVAKIDSKPMTEKIDAENMINVSSRLNVSRIEIYTKDGNLFSFYVDSLGQLYSWLDGLKMLLNDNSALSDDTMYQIDALTKIRTDIQLIDLADRQELKFGDVKHDSLQLESLAASHFYYE